MDVLKNAFDEVRDRFRAIGRSDGWQRHNATVAFFIWTVLVYSFLPVWLTLFVMYLTGHWENVVDIANHGAFFVYSAALLASALEMMDGYQGKKTSLVSYIYRIAQLLLRYLPAPLSTAAPCHSCITPQK